MADTKKPDAVLYQSEHKTGPDTLSRVKVVQDKFGPILGCANVYSRDAIGVGILCVTHSDLDTSSYLTSEKTPRYEWVPQADGTQWGYLIASGGAPKEQEAAVAAQ
jgi:hypothetical protein